MSITIEKWDSMKRDNEILIKIYLRLGTIEDRLDNIEHTLRKIEDQINREY